MRSFTYEGKGSDGTNLIPGKLYKARFISAIKPETGEPYEEPHSTFLEYKAVKSGRLFAMRAAPTFKWYHLPQYFEFLEDYDND